MWPLAVIILCNVFFHMQLKSSTWDISLPHCPSWGLICLRKSGWKPSYTALLDRTATHTSLTAQLRDQFVTISRSISPTRTSMWTSSPVFCCIIWYRLILRTIGFEPYMKITSLALGLTISLSGSVDSWITQFQHRGLSEHPHHMSTQLTPVILENPSSQIQVVLKW